MKHFSKKQIVLGVLLALILALNIYYLQMKSGYYVDEGMTLFLSNGNYNGAVTSQADGNLYDFLEKFVFKDSVSATISNLFSMLSELVSAGNYSKEGTVEWYDAARSLLQGHRTWVNGQELFEQLTASRGERFQYAQVYINQAMDVHPPLYYLLVHTVFSLFPGTYSDAYLFVINIIALLGSCVVLYKTSKIISQNSLIAMLSVVIFGFSQGFVSCTLYFRMYALFTLFALLTVYIHLRMEQKEYVLSKKLSRMLVLIIVLGFYTHYYYIIFLFPFFAITVLKLLLGKEKVKLINYIKKMILAGFISLVIWPLSLYHILFGYRGTEAVANVIADGLMTRMKNYYHVLIRAFFYNSGCFFFIMLTVGLVLTVFCIKNGLRKRIISLCDVLFPCLFYFVIVNQIAPSQSDRYIMCIYPVISLLLACVVTKAIETVARIDKVKNVLVIAVSGAIMICAICVIKPNYLYLEKREGILGLTQDPSQLNCLMIADDDWRGFPEAVKLSRFNQIMVLGQTELEDLKKEKPANTETDMIIYVLKELDQDAMLQQACSSLEFDFSMIENISSDLEGFNAYLVEAEAN